MYDGITEESKAKCWGFFADGDTTVNYKKEFSEHFDNGFDFHGEHRMDNKVMRDVILQTRLKDIHQMSKPPRRYSGYGQNRSFFSKTFTDVESPPESHDSQVEND